MKKLISLILVLAALFSSLIIPTYAAQPNEVSPQYTNAKEGGTTLSINSSGEVTVVVRLAGSSDVTEISVKTYLERKIGNTWYRVLVAPWTYSVSTSSLFKVFSGQIDTSGNYRARSIFTVTGTTVESITVISEYTY